MDVTAQLLRLFQVDKQYRGLQTRLNAAEKFLAEQTKQLADISSKASLCEAQIKQLTAVVANHEGETKRLDARMETIRGQMNSAQTNKEYKAFLTEVNTLKAERDRFETQALESMSRLDEIKKQLEGLVSQKVERERVKGVAAQERDTRAAEIKDRLAELKTERDALTKGIAADTLTVFERLVATKGDEAMAPVEVADRKRHEYNCGSCMMHLPVETVSGLLSGGRLTRCVSCSSILYLTEEDAKSLQPAASKR
ncbi:MAG: hypothetical protein SFY96_06660 [Planctomycetota bacterium]|nr:hypothetical protein [Planctomycetota bacterium]